jgi:hypothetical protein
MLSIRLKAGQVDAQMHRPLGIETRLVMQQATRVARSRSKGGRGYGSNTGRGLKDAVAFKVSPEIIVWLLLD